MYGRYAHENSLAFKEGFLNIPLVNIWIEDFKKALKKKFPTLHHSTIHHSTFNQPTILMRHLHLRIKNCRK